MNYLVHLFLSDPDPHCRLGNLMGDFVKGRLRDGDFPPRVLAGLRQHRAVDRIAQGHPAVRRSKMRLDDRFKHTKSILIDIFYDHLLARHWDRWGHGTLADFARAAYDLLARHDHLLVDPFRPVAARMIAHDWLVRYRYPGTIKVTLEKIGQRLACSNRLAEGHLELERCGEAMAVECEAFLSSVRDRLNRESAGGD